MSDEIAIANSIVRDLKEVAEKTVEETKKVVSSVIAAEHGQNLETKANAGMRELSASEFGDSSRADSGIPGYRPQLEADGPWPFPAHDQAPGDHAPGSETGQHDPRPA